MAEQKVVDLHAAVDEVLTVDPGNAGRATLPLVSLEQLKVLVVGVRKGATWKEHSTARRISVQVLKGRIRMRALGREFELSEGNLLALDSNVKHDIEGLEDSAFLLTVAK